jgi:2-phosphosulfolactate phosphatase
MKPVVRVCFLPSEIDVEWLKPGSAVVIDLLRASTSVVHALAHGARDVIPVETPAKAQELRGSIGRDGVLLCGERGGVTIEGFDLGNSPAEYRVERVSGKTLIFCSSNGTGALLAAREANRLAMAGLANAGATVDWIVAGSADALLVCSGQLGRYSAEDAACAGFLAARLLERGFLPGNDAATTALLLAEQTGSDWLAFLLTTDHGRYLTGLGFGPDLEAAAALDTIPLVPEWKAMRLTCSRQAVQA